MSNPYPEGNKGNYVLALRVISLISFISFALGYS